MSYHNEPLPYGWVEEHDQSGRVFFVDTIAEPPRSIWVHPYEDELFLKEHPDIREKVGHNNRHSYQPPSGPPPGHAGGSTNDNRNSNATHTKGKPRGFLGKIKDKAIGTKEEREAERQRNAILQEQRRQQMEARRQQMLANRPVGGYGAPPMGQGGYYRQQPMMGGGMMGGGGYGGGGYGGGQRRGGGMGGMAMPLVGGLAGGMLLGSMLDNDNDYGGGGGDFDGGGDFGGD